LPAAASFESVKTKRRSFQIRLGVRAVQKKRAVAQPPNTTLGECFVFHFRRSRGTWGTFMGGMGERCGSLKQMSRSLLLSAHVGNWAAPKVPNLPQVYRRKAYVAEAPT
jgi:hypothetical protein